MTQIEKAISKLKIVDLNSEYAYSTIENIIRNDIVRIGLPSKVFSAGLLLHRSRNNDETNDLLTVSDLSFRIDEDNISQFGRANKPHQSIFYAADVRPTALGETSKCFRGESEDETTVITTGHWETIEELKLTLIVNNEIAQDKNELINSYGADIEELTASLFGENAGNILTLLRFISDEFSVNTLGNSNLYKISCAFSQFAYSTNDGVIYPSLQRQFEGLNFALKPDSVTRKLQLNGATRDTFRKSEINQYSHIETKDTIRIDGNNLIWGNPRTIER